MVRNGMRPLVTVLAAVSLLIAVASSDASAGTRVSIFYYPWYGTPELDGGYQHWQQNGARPPHGLASAFFPLRGLYSSGNPAVLRGQMREIARAGIDQVAASWWGWGSVEDLRLPAIVQAGRLYGLDVAVHLEPYAGRTPESTLADIRHLQELGATDFYLYGPQDATAEQWRAALTQLSGVRVFGQTTLRDSRQRPASRASTRTTSSFTRATASRESASRREESASSARLPSVPATTHAEQSETSA